MKFNTLHKLILSAQECDNVELFALECGGSLPESVSDEEAFELLGKIHAFAHDFNFHHIRALSGLSQNRMAQEYGIPPRTIQAWDEGHRTPPSYLLIFLFLDVIQQEKTA